MDERVELVKLPFLVEASSQPILHEHALILLSIEEANELKVKVLQLKKEKKSWKINCTSQLLRKIKLSGILSKESARSRSLKRNMGKKKEKGRITSIA